MCHLEVLHIFSCTQAHHLLFQIYGCVCVYAYMCTSKAVDVYLAMCAYIG